MAFAGTRRRTLRRYAEGLKEVFKIIVSDKAGLVGFIIIIIYILMGTIGPMVVPYPAAGNPNEVYLPPSWEHPLGTDFEGKDVFAQIVHGTPVVLTVAFLTGFLTTLIGVFLGALAGFKGGIADTIIMGTADFILTIPQFPLFAVLSALVKFKDVTMLSVLLASVSWPTLARAIRSQILSMKEREFIEAARLLGFSTFDIIFTEMIPNIMPYIAVSFMFNSIYAIYAQVGLAYLGLVPFIGENWGLMLNRAWVLGAFFYEGSIWYIISPIIAIVGLQIGFLLFARVLEVIFNPRLRVGG